MLTQATARSGTRALAVVQSLTPYLTLAMAPIGLAALTRRRTAMTLAASVVGIGGVVLARPVLFPPALPAVADAGTRRLRIASLNLLYTNSESNVAAVAADLRDRDLDVIVLVEYTAGHQRVFRESGLADDFEYRVERSGPGASGIGIWSKSPTVAVDRAGSTDRIVEVTIEFGRWSDPGAGRACPHAGQ